MRRYHVPQHAASLPSREPVDVKPMLAVGLTAATVLAPQAAMADETTPAETSDQSTQQAAATPTDPVEAAQSAAQADVESKVNGDPGVQAAGQDVQDAESQQAKAQSDVKAAQGQQASAQAGEQAAQAADMAAQTAARQAQQAKDEAQQNADQTAKAAAGDDMTKLLLHCR